MQTLINTIATKRCSVHFKRRDTSLARFNLHVCRTWRLNVKFINLVSSKWKFFLTVLSLFPPADDQLTNIFALSVLRGNIITSCQKDMDDLFDSVPTLETRFAPLSHLPRAASRLQPLVSREQVEIKAPQRTSPFGSGPCWDDAKACFKERTGKQKRTGTFIRG